MATSSLVLINSNIMNDSRLNDLHIDVKINEKFFKLCERKFKTLKENKIHYTLREGKLQEFVHARNKLSKAYKEYLFELNKSNGGKIILIYQSKMNYDFNI